MTELYRCPKCGAGVIGNGNGNDNPTCIGTIRIGDREMKAHEETKMVPVRYYSSGDSADIDPEQELNFVFKHRDD